MRTLFCTFRKLVPVVLILFTIHAALLTAQPKGKSKPSKLVLGTVVDQDDHPIPTAIVSLTNLETQKIQQDITDDKGEVRFAGLSPDKNYELQVQYHNVVGEKNSISIYDTRAKREFYWKLPLKWAEAQKEIQLLTWVSDEQGRGLAGATVKFTATKKIQTLTATTDPQGFASKWLSTEDTYSIVTAAPGYETLVKEAFTPSSNMGKMLIQLKAAK